MLHFYKYREMFSHGWSSWKWHIIPSSCGLTAKDIPDQLDHSNLLSNWSEHWRKVEVKRIYKPPLYLIERELKQSEEWLKWATNKFTYYRKLKNDREEMVRKTKKFQESGCRLCDRRR